MEKSCISEVENFKKYIFAKFMSYTSPKYNGTICFVYIKSGAGGRIIQISGRSDFKVFSYKKWTLNVFPSRILF